ncbi:GGDEF domain-containing protein [Actinoplanes aureus]|uniref:GGDEF domain-containing protein n=1 Tax=Actinoplanes aureus TaxID=2792083 RepID=A0A931CDN5_9ACTN|nr:GGDEF domain-containing protein [Actinoplanes aureus]MBG0564243.1 GGDEF domain-containing protein [Actinoplanes aureus]
MVEVSVHEQRLRAIRAGALYCSSPAVFAAVYAAATWGAPGRGAMLTVALTILVAAGLAGAVATRLVASRWWMLPQHAGAFVNLTGYVVLALLDGGIAGPLGAFIPTSTVLLATVLLPRAFLSVVVLNAIGYGLVVVHGDPAPPGYWLVHALGFGAAAVLCLRHSMALASLRRRLADTSRTDPLTGCLNRRGFDDRVAAALASGGPVTLVLLDLDHFKQVNDAHGHQAGDELLAWVGHELRGSISAPAVAGRLGGDEFALLLPGTGSAEAARVVDRVRNRLRAGAPSSLGSATFPQDARDADGLASVADRRLYADKAAGDRRAPTDAEVAQARSRATAAGPAATVSGRERRRHSIADPGWMSIAQTCVALVYLALFTAGHPHRGAMLVICLWGFAAGLAVVLGADWLSRSRRARPLMLAFSASSFASLAVMAVLDGGVSSTLGVGMLLPIPLLMLGMRPRVAAPLTVAAGALYAVLAVTGGASSGWYVVTNLLGTAATAVACALQGRTAAAQRRLLTRLARVDVLTGVLNRRGFGEQFTAELGHVRRHRLGAALLIADLDEFKKLNDEYGHAAGDEMLRWVAATIRSGARPHDVVGRLGGDEFVMLICGDRPGEVAERLRAALAERIRVSIGVAVLDQDGTDFDSLYAAADARLYQEKKARKLTEPGPVHAPAAGALL